MIAENAYPALVLNADYQPLSTYPLYQISWQKALDALFGNRMHVVAWYNAFVRSERERFQLPSVLALKEYLRMDRPAPCNRWTIFLRDEFRCQYCGARFSPKDLTFDHVLPRSRGGSSKDPRNLVACCLPCNGRKADRTPREARMDLLRVPHHPTLHQLNAIGRKFPPRWCHETWTDVLYWDVELEA